MSEDLVNEIKIQQQNSKNLTAQLDACKVMYNDSSNLILQLRTQLNLMNGNLQELNQKLDQANKDNANYKDQINLLIDKVNELTPKPVEVKNAPDKINK